MNQFTFHAVKTFKNNCSESRCITFEYDEYLDKRSDALLSVISDHECLHDRYLIDHDTKCNITFDMTVEIKGGLYEETKRGYLSDRHFFTFNDLKDYIDEIQKDSNVLRIVKQPFMRWLYSNSGNAIESLAMNNLINKSETPFDGGLFYDSSLHWEKIKDRLVRNSFNEVVYL